MDIRAVLEYDGTDYYGFQAQPDRTTVQTVVEEALASVYKKEIKIKYTSRTDRGVHSKGQVISFSPVFEYRYDKLERMLNDRLPASIIIKDIKACGEGYNPRYESSSKLYTYRIWNCREMEYRFSRYTWHIPVEINWEKIEDALRILSGKHDFRLFSAETGDKNTVIDVISADLEKTGCLYEIKIRAPFFLMYMIRYIIGFLAAMGKGSVDQVTLREKLEGFGEKVSYCAPASGLELTEVYM